MQAVSTTRLVLGRIITQEQRRRGVYSVGSGGYQIPWLRINQQHVITSYNLGLLSLSDFPLQLSP